MRGLLVAANLLLAAAYSGFVNGEGTDVTENEVYHERNSGRVGTVQLFQTRAGSEYEEERDREVTSSGDYFIELPRVAFLSKPQELVTPKKKGNGKKRRKGKGMGKKRDPCLQKYKDFCIHGECKYIKELGAPSCICQPGYHGERCHGLTLPVENPSTSYDHTTALAVVAVVLSSMCLIIIAALLMLRCHKRGVYDVENEEKIKLGIAVNP
ncbi:proheparin-binding EGF-like growth factor [Alligator mississippiensis]|uniref:proheparin-binding EGF-like growth factor n=1 Tax=Alligator mississippiensis TaxID=8496 RepID=UPI0003D079C7|nr:proheparin-binding EGF-like growth factor [Alligator mississippiensis]